MSFTDVEAQDGDQEEKECDDANEHPNRKLWRRNWSTFISVTCKENSKFGITTNVRHCNQPIADWHITQPVEAGACLTPVGPDGSFVQCERNVLLDTRKMNHALEPTPLFRWDGGKPEINARLKGPIMVGKDLRVLYSLVKLLSISPPEHGCVFWIETCSVAAHWRGGSLLEKKHRGLFWGENKGISGLLTCQRHQVLESYLFFAETFVNIPDIVLAFLGKDGCWKSFLSEDKWFHGPTCVWWVVPVVLQPPTPLFLDAELWSLLHHTQTDWKQSLPWSHRPTRSHVSSAKCEYLRETNVSHYLTDKL